MRWAVNDVLPKMILRTSVLSVLSFFCAAGALAQLGDRGEGEGTQAGAPPSPVLAPEDALASFVLPPGFRIELVAGEPLVMDPVVVSFDPKGRLWVVEMPGYNREILDLLPVYLGGQSAPPEEALRGRVAVLEDKDGDGAMDRRRVFADGLNLPRAIGFVDGGVLIGDPPHLWFYPDADGPGRASDRIEIASDFGAPEMMATSPNGLLRGMDNWIHVASYGHRLRWTRRGWLGEPTLRRGQWGIGAAVLYVQQRYATGGFVSGALRYQKCEPRRICRKQHPDCPRPDRLADPAHDGSQSQL